MFTWSNLILQYAKSQQNIQIWEDDFPIMFVSQKLNPTEKNHSTTNGKALGGINCEVSNIAQLWVVVTLKWASYIIWVQRKGWPFNQRPSKEATQLVLK